MTIPTLSIIYSREFDTQRVLNTIGKLEWYIEHKYDQQLSFPKTLDKEKLKGYSEDDIRLAVDREYSEEKYSQNEDFLLSYWKKVSREIASAFSLSGLVCPNQYRIFFTKYGTGGSYDMPDTVIVNLNKVSGISMVKTVVHEIIHLGIEKYIDEYAIDQPTKERIVDLFFVKNFPRMAILQNVYMLMDTSSIDQAFDDAYPDMKAVMAGLSG